MAYNLTLHYTEITNKIICFEKGVYADIIQELIAERENNVQQNVVNLLDLFL